MVKGVDQGGVEAGGCEYLSNLFETCETLRFKYPQETAADLDFRALDLYDQTELCELALSSSTEPDAAVQARQIESNLRKSAEDYEDKVGGMFNSVPPLGKYALMAHVLLVLDSPADAISVRMDKGLDISTKMEKVYPKYVQGYLLHAQLLSMKAESESLVPDVSNDQNKKAVIASYQEQINLDLGFASSINPAMKARVSLLLLSPDEETIKALQAYKANPGDLVATNKAIAGSTSSMAVFRQEASLGFESRKLADVNARVALLNSLARDTDLMTLEAKVANFQDQSWSSKKNANQRFDDFIDTATTALAQKQYLIAEIWANSAKEFAGQPNIVIDKEKLSSVDQILNSVRSHTPAENIVGLF